MNTPPNHRGNVTPLGRIKCPVGAHAIHRKQGFCEILAARGAHRLIGYEEHIPDETPDVDDLPEGMLADEVLFSEKIIWHETWVPVAELAEINPRIDLYEGELGRVLPFPPR